MKGYLTLERFNEFKVDNQKNFNDIEKMMQKLASKVSVETQIDKIKNEIFEKMKLFSMRKDVTNDKQVLV